MVSDCLKNALLFVQTLPFLLHVASTGVTVAMDSVWLVFQPLTHQLMAGKELISQYYSEQKYNRDILCSESVCISEQILACGRIWETLKKQSDVLEQKRQNPATIF